jgi:MarR family transcriptional regulator, organic hydroperoxide resistance regulator
MENQVAQFRSFNRFYTSVIGILDNHYLNSNFSLTEVRILYELHYTAEGLTARELTEMLKLDKGYLSRILQQFEKQELVSKEKSKLDARSAYLRLTQKGESVFKPLDQASQQQAMGLLKSISELDVKRLLESMETIKLILGKINPLTL